MLEQFLGSKSRACILELFFSLSDQWFSQRDIAKRLKLQPEAVKKEIALLQRLKILRFRRQEAMGSRHGRGQIVYGVNERFSLFKELRDFILKAKLLFRRDFVDDIIGSGEIKFFCLTGIFLNLREITKTDILIVGKVNRQKFTRVVKIFEKELGDEIYYTIFSEKDFLYRIQITDQFVHNVLDHHPLIVVDTLTYDPPS
jgi:hypothetical protein